MLLEGDELVLVLLVSGGSGVRVFLWYELIYWDEVESLVMFDGVGVVVCFVGVVCFISK